MKTTNEYDQKLKELGNVLMFEAGKISSYNNIKYLLENNAPGFKFDFEANGSVKVGTFNNQVYTFYYMPKEMRKELESDLKKLVEKYLLPKNARELDALLEGKESVE